MSPIVRCGICEHPADDHTADPFRPACRVALARVDAPGESCDCPGFQVRRPKEKTPNARWRVGTKLGRTLYIGDDLVGMMDTTGLAANVVVAMNRLIEASFDVRESVRARVPLHPAVAKYPSDDYARGRMDGQEDAAESVTKSAERDKELRERLKIYGRAFRVRHVENDWPALEHVIAWMENGGLSTPPETPTPPAEDDLPRPGSRAAGLAEDRRNAEIARRGIRDAAESLMEGAIASDIKSLKRRVNALESFVFGLRGVLADQNVRLDDPNQRALRAALDAYDKSKEDPDA